VLHNIDLPKKAELKSPGMPPNKEETTMRRSLGAAVFCGVAGIASSHTALSAVVDQTNQAVTATTKEATQLAAAPFSSATTYGILDVGITSITNANGSHLIREQSGVAYGNRLGVKGSEKLGDDTNVFFGLEAGFRAETGASQTPNTLFNRGAFVGIGNRQFGTLSMGSQNEFMFSYLTYFSGGPMGGPYTFQPGDYDLISGLNLLNNSVQYQSPEIGGFKLGAMYALGERPGSLAAGSGRSFGLSFRSGRVMLGAAFTGRRDLAIRPSVDLGINTLFGAPLSGTAMNAEINAYGAGALYDFGRFKLRGLVTAAEILANGNSRRLISKQTNLTHDFTPAVYGGLSLNHSSLEENRWNKVAAFLSYAFSKRTSAYVEGAYLRVSQGNRAQILSLPPSSSNAQGVSRVAMFHKF
jgi:outer membrane protein OmpU